MPQNPAGEPLDLSPDALDQAAEITTVDVVLARALWLHSAPPPLATLLDSPPEPNAG